MTTIKRELREELPTAGQYIAEWITPHTVYVDSYGEDIHSRIYMVILDDCVQEVLKLDPNLEIHDLSELDDPDYVRLHGIAGYTSRHIRDVFAWSEDGTHHSYQKLEIGGK